MNLVFQDEFDINSINDEYWSTHSSSPSPFDRILPRGNCNFNNAAVLTDSNVLVRDGELLLIAKREDVSYTGRAEGEPGQALGCDLIGNDSFEFNQKFTSGSIFGKKGYNHGLFECRAKITSAKGLYPVFWLWHHDEIVVFEFFGNPDLHFVSAHNKEKYVSRKFDKRQYAEEYITYSVYWTGEQISWFVDDEAIWTICKEEAEVLWTCQNNSIQENTGYNVIESFPDNADRWLSPNVSLRIYEWSEEIETSKLPDTLKLDYIRIYQ